MADNLRSLDGRELGRDSSGYHRFRTGIKTPALLLGPSGSEVDDMGVTAGSTGTTITAGGVTTLASTAGNNTTFNISAPKVGVRKSLISTGASTSQLVSSTGASATFNSTSTGTSTKATFAGVGAALHLVGLSTSLWGVIGNVGAVAFSS